MICTQLRWIVVAPMLFASTPTYSQAANAPAAAATSKQLTRLQSLTNIFAALTTSIGGVSSLVSAVDKLVSTGSVIIDRSSAKALLKRLNKLSAATSRAETTQTFVIRDMEDYVRARGTSETVSDEKTRKGLEAGWGRVKGRVQAARNEVIKLDKQMVKESSSFVRTPSYASLYAAINSRRQLLEGVNLNGSGVLTVEETAELKKVAGAYTTLHEGLKPTVLTLNDYIDALEKSSSKTVDAPASPSAKTS